MHIDIHDLHVFIGDSHVLQGLSLRIGGGKRVVLIGRNGAGKSTLARALVGLSGPSPPGALMLQDEGAVSFAGPRDISVSTAWERNRLGLGYVPQGRRVFASLSVEDNLRVAARPPRDGSAPVWALEQLYDLFPRLKERRRQPASVLSGGEQQMLAIARALSGHPRILVLDEPTEGLSPLMIVLVAETLEKVSGSGVDLLLFEQNLSVAARLAQQLHVMQSGRIIHTQANVNETQMGDLAERYLGV
jgi:branched-chain amino acid transport system ATP-binding protein